MSPTDVPNHDVSKKDETHEAFCRDEFGKS